MLKIKTLTIGQMQTNCYLIFDQENKDCLIIDPGDDADYISKIILELKLNPLKIIATHGHFDHILGVTELKLNFNTPFFINPSDYFLVANMAKNAQFFLGIKTGPPPKIDGRIKDKEEVVIGTHKLLVIKTAGHTPGSICLYCQKQQFLITGDTLFANGTIGRTDFSYSSSPNLKKSLLKIFKLPAETIIYPGHGEKSNLQSEKQYHLFKTLNLN